MKRFATIVVLVALGGGSLTLTGCSHGQTGALLGSAIGSAAGAGIDHRNRGRGALLGAGVGAVGGYIVGNEMDKREARERRYRYDY